MPKRKKSQAISKNRKKTVKSLVAPAVATAVDLINNLNDDCLLKICRYLSIADRLRVELVCKRWRQVCQMAWQDLKILDFSDCGRDTTDLYKLPLNFRSNQGVGRILKKFGRYVQQLKLGDPCDYNILPIVGKYCSNLTRLEIDIYGYDKSCAKFFPRMEKLKYFEIIGIRCYPREVFRTLPSDTLTEIHLWTYGPGTPHYMIYLGSLPLIAPTAIENFTKLTSISLNGFNLKANMIDVISNNSNLKYLSLEFSVCRDGLPRLSCLTNLEHLNLCTSRKVDDSVLMEISECCTNLKYLNLRSCRKITDQGITNLRKLPQLEELLLAQISGITGTCLLALHHLKRINCAWCESIHDDVIIGLIRNAVNLDYLNVAYSGITKNILDAANEIMRQRKTPLHLSVSLFVKKAWSKVDISPLLVVRDDEENSVWNRLFS